MKKLFFIASIFFLTSIAVQLKAQNTPKQKTDTAKTCKPTKSGKHCSKPSNG